jgi:hypothetical protein
LQSKDASFVACTDKAERDRVRDSFLKEKIALGGADAELDQAVITSARPMTVKQDGRRQDGRRPVVGLGTIEGD